MSQKAISEAIPGLPAGCGQGSAAAADLEDHGSPAEAARALGIELPPAVQRSVRSRQLEFIAGRVAAAAALRAAGLAQVPGIPIGADRAPVWPPGYVGSITHSAGSAWAVAAPATRVRAIGIDLERIIDAQLMRELGARVVASEEGQLAVPHWPATRLFSLVFSAKESAYKCLAAHGGGGLEFLDLRLVALDAGTGTLRLRLLRPCGPALPEGFELDGGFSAAARQLRTWACWPAR